MGGYQYLVASLPAISLSVAPPYTPEQFRFSCQGVLSDGDLAELDLILAGQAESGSSEFSQAWAAADAQIRNTVARDRAAKLGVDVRSFLHEHSGYRVWLDKEVADAMAKPNPLDREMALDMVRWHFCEDMALTDDTGMPAVLGFAVRLMLANRWAGMDAEAGRNRLEDLVTKLEENATQSGAVSFT